MKLSEIRSVSGTEFVRVDDDPPPYFEPRGVAEHLGEVGAREGRTRVRGVERLRRFRAGPLRLVAGYGESNHRPAICSFERIFIYTDDLAPRIAAGRGAGTGSAWPAALRLLALRRDATTRDTLTIIAWYDDGKCVVSTDYMFYRRCFTPPLSPHRAKAWLLETTR